MAELNASDILLTRVSHFELPENNHKPVLNIFRKLIKTVYIASKKLLKNVTHKVNIHT